MLRLFCVLAIVCIAAGRADAAELYDRNGQSIDITIPPTWPAPPGLRRQPVLFVHGHAADSSADPNYRKNFWEDSDDDPLLAFFNLTSLKETLDDPINSGLDVEAYYIRFDNRSRSITEDAFDTGEVVDYIVQRHNENFDPATATMPPPVQVAIIGYSKGTLSTRQYLKSLQVQVQDNGGISMPVPRPGYRPVSEFIAIAPPNHGISSSFFSEATDQISIQQLYNGVQPEGSGCGTPFPNLFPQAANFIEILNGETAFDGQVSNAGSAAGEAPGSRPPGGGPHNGTLYVTIFDNRDLVGGESPSTTDCPGAGRGFASNLSSDAINIATAVPGTLSGTVHRNTPHTQDVVCKTLFAVVHHRSPENQTCLLSGRVPIIPLPNPAAAMLALDISGSMLARQCATCPTRYEVLRQAVAIFVQLWSQAGRPNDRLGVTYFRTVVDEPSIAGERLPVLTGNTTTVIADVDGQNVVAANLTAMGGGLQRSIETLRALPADQAEARHVILFSDGMQNVNPMVLPPQHVVIDNETGRPASGVTPAVPPLRLDALAPLKVHTIAVGAGAFVSVLSDIANRGQGLAQQTLDADDLRQFFVEQLIDALRGSSPQLIGYRRGTLRQASATESFQVNAGARKLLFKVSWQPGQSLDVRAFQNGTDVTNLARVVSGDFYRLLAISASPKGGGGPAPGAWRLQISGKPGTNYEAAAIVDDEELHYRARLEPMDGQLALMVEVTRGRRPVGGPLTVTATVTRPRVAIGEVLAAMKPLPAGRRGTEPGMTTAERQVAAFLQDPRQRERLRPVSEAVRLVRDGRGGFRAVLANARIPGLYRAEVRINGEDRQLGRIERSQTVTASLPFGEADRATSAFTLRTSPGNRAIELLVRPADRRGNLLGPGFAGQITLEVSNRKIDRDPEDLGDGRYRFVLSHPGRADPSLTVAVHGRPLFRGTMKQLRGRRGG